MTLALLGGPALRSRSSWPSWPQVASKTKEQLLGALESHRWTLRSRWTGEPTRERLFAERFAALHDARFCSTAPSGSMALQLALEALDIGAGDEVIIPGLTWVATAIAVLNVNAVPVLVEVDPETFCISPEAVRSVVTSRTRCVIPVHYHCALADMEEIVAVADRHGLAVLEDCAQAHGARRAGRSVGTFGQAGAFSMHNDKLLTCGEGGAILTSDPDIHRRLNALRLDGFDLGTPQSTVEGFYEIAEVSDLMGGSHCLSEFQAAVLLGQLEELPEQNLRRERNGLYLNELLRQMDGLRPLPRAADVELQPFYEYAVRFEPDAFSGCGIYAVCRALAAELAFPVYPEGPPIHRHPLYKPLTKRKYCLGPEHRRRLDLSGCHLQVAERAQEELILFLHPPLLGTRHDIDDIAEAFAKVQRHASVLARIEDRVDSLATPPTF